MRDIVYKRVQTAPQEEPPAQQAVVSEPFVPVTIPDTEPAPARALEKIGETAAAAGSWLKNLIDPEPPQIVITEPVLTQEGYRTDTEGPKFGRKQAHEKKKRQKGEAAHAVKKAAGKAVHGAKKAATSAKNSLKTPTGKVAAINAAAVLALFAYVQQTHQRNHSTDQTNGTAVASGSHQLRQYLPTSQDYSQPKPYQNTLADVQQKDVPLHVWMTPWNIDVLQANDTPYRSVSAFWLTLKDDGSSLETKADWKAWTDFASSHKKDGQKFYLTISANPDYSYLALTDPKVQEKHIANLLQAVQEHGFDGIDIDYEGLGSENRDLFTEFVRNLTTAFHSHHKDVAVTVEARIANRNPMDWHALSSTADQIRIMVYDYHSQKTNFPGPITPIGWLKEVLDYAQANIDPSKLVIGLGNYGRDWVETTDKTGWEGQGVSFDQAVALAQQKDVPIIRATGIDDRGYDIGSTPTFVYKDEQDRQHAVWFEDNASLQAKISLIGEYRTSGYILWSVGLGDNALWKSQANQQ